MSRTGDERFATDWPSAISAKVPPSPLLSVRRRMMTYFNVTIRITVQIINDSTPRIVAAPPMWCSLAAEIASFMA